MGGINHPAIDKRPSAFLKLMNPSIALLKHNDELEGLRFISFSSIEVKVVYRKPSGYEKTGDYSSPVASQ